jgi:hypothetical protein
MRRAQTFIPEGTVGVTVSFDGKTIFSTRKTAGYESPLHIISAQLAELGIILVRQMIEGKSNEIPAMRELLALMDIKSRR